MRGSGMPYRYDCHALPSMEDCAGSFTTTTQEELEQHWTFMLEAHDQDPSQWPEEVQASVRSVIREVP
jgi:hypothetical protein